MNKSNVVTCLLFVACGAVLTGCTDKKIHRRTVIDTTEVVSEEIVIEGDAAPAQQDSKMTRRK